MNNEAFDNIIKQKLQSNLQTVVTNDNINNVMARINTKTIWYKRIFSFKLSTLILAGIGTLTIFGIIIINLGNYSNNDNSTKNINGGDNLIGHSKSNEFHENKISKTENVAQISNPKSDVKVNILKSSSSNILNADGNMKANLNEKYDLNKKLIKEADAQEVSTINDKENSPNKDSKVYDGNIQNEKNIFPKSELLSKIIEDRKENPEGNKIEEINLPIKYSLDKLPLKPIYTSISQPLLQINLNTKEPIKPLIENVFSRWSVGIGAGSGEHMAEAGIMIKYNLAKHFSLATSLKFRTEFRNNYDNEADFHNHKGIEFKEFYKNEVKNQEDFSSIKIEQNVLEIPFWTEYKNGYFKYFNLISTLGASIIVVDRHDVEYKTTSNGEENFNAIIKNKKIGNLQFGLGAEKSFGKFNLQLLPMLTLSEFAKEGHKKLPIKSNVQVRLFYNF